MGSVMKKRHNVARAPAAISHTRHGPSGLDVVILIMTLRPGLSSFAALRLTGDRIA